ncbi:MAG: MATE family efflux transporter [Clostridia bacterium]|nr:MATE family efflux transporter [Clostridia bacterium]
MQKNNDFLANEPVGKLLFRLAIPTVTAQLINMLYNIVDRIYIGHMPGSGNLALTGVGICMPIIIIISAFAALVGMGGSPRASIALGRGDTKSAEDILGSCFTLQTIVAIVLTVIVFIFRRPMLMAFGGSVNTIDYATDYLGIYSLGTLFVQLTLGMNVFITAQGFARTGMFTVLIGAVLNIALDPLFIFAFDMGVKGAALATIVSQGASCIWVLKFLTGKTTTLRIRKENLRIRPKVILPCLALGVSPFIMQASESVISICFNSSLLKYGGDMAVGAMTIFTSVIQLAMLPLNGIAQGAQPITSYNYGAGNVDRVKKSFRLLLVTSIVYAAVLWAFVMICPKTFAGIFTNDAALIDFCGKMMRVYCGAIVVFGLQIACQMTFIAIGNAVCSIIAAVVRKFVLILPLIYIMPAVMNDKTMAVYMAEPVSDVLAVTFTVILFSIQFKKAIRNLESKSKASA